MSIGLSIDDVALKLKKPVDEIISWESGKSAPSYPQLEKLAYKVYKRPLAIFFFPEPPEETSPKKEFRSLPESDLDNLHPDTYLHVRQGHAYQLSLKEVFDDQNPAKEMLWNSAPLNINDDIQRQASKIRDILGITIEAQSRVSSVDEALKLWRSKIEEKGVFVFKSSFKQKDISGFCLSDDQFPLIYLNNTTTKTRQIFSLFHELAHILLNTKSLSKFEHSYFKKLPEEARKIEVFCNAVAAEVLIPEKDFKHFTATLPNDIETVEEDKIAAIASRYCVSRESILRRFLDMGRVSSPYYLKKAEEWASQKKSAGGGNWYASTNSYLSNTFAKEVVSQYYKQRLSLESASDMLGIKAKNFDGLEQRILQGSTI